MSVQAQTRSVYFSFSPIDAAVAAEIRKSLLDHSLHINDANTFYDGETEHDTAVNIRQAIRESDALVVLATPASIHSQWLALELGIAVGLKKLVYVVPQQVDLDTLPTRLKLFPVIRLEKVSQLAERISRF